MKITVSASYHTPGPWMAVPGGRHDQEVIITTQHRLDQSFSEICGMDVEFTGKHGDEQKANARLIAAAPTMYEYIISSASDGCATAKKIMEAINASS